MAMVVTTSNVKTYTIKETAKLSGLPESTLRYYETIGLIDPIERDASSKYRVYTEDDVNLIVAIACLNATGLSLEDMRQYLKNRDLGPAGAHNQTELLKAHYTRLSEEVHYMQLRLDYVKSKLAYWQAAEAGDNEQLEQAAKTAYTIAAEMKLPKPPGKD